MNGNGCCRMREKELADSPMGSYCRPNPSQLHPASAIANIKAAVTHHRASMGTHEAGSPEAAVAISGRLIKFWMSPFSLLQTFGGGEMQVKGLMAES